MKIVFLEPLGISKEQLMEKVSAKVPACHQVVYYDSRVTDTETLIERSKDADVVVLSNFPYRKEVMEHCPNLKMICVAFTGVDHVDIDYCRKRGITVCNCAGYSTSAVADIVFAMVISLARNIVKCDERCRNGETKDGLVGFELDGKSLGVIGYGAIGRRVAHIAKAFGCKVYASNRSPKCDEGVIFTDTETLLKTCDIVSVHVPQNKDTVDLIGEKELKLMKKSAILINTARGPVVNEKALTEALKNGTIAAAGIDVFDKEPPLDKNKELLSLDNVIVTPHIAFATQQAFEKRADIVAENIKLWLESNPQNVVC